MKEKLGKEKEKMKNKSKTQKGITLIALIVTIIIMIILASVSVNLLLGENGLITRAKQAKIVQEKAEIVEGIRLEVMQKEMSRISKGETLSQVDIEEVLSKYGTIVRDEYGKILKLEVADKGFEISYTELYINAKTTVANGTWNTIKQVNTPKLEGTGLTAIYWNTNGEEKELTSNSKAEEWANWYDYDNQKWANAVTKDENGNKTGYFVWIPRYEYYLDSTNKTISINFISKDVHGSYGTGENAVTATTGYTTDANGITRTTKDGKTYIIHPAFTKDTDYGYQNGGWREEISGFWVAKYAAGFQNGTIGEEARTVAYSNLKYTTVFSIFPNNFLGVITVDSENTANSTSLSYPVFKANTYAYNIISASDSFVLAKEIKNASSFYGLSNVDSHLEKNSEWGAVAYLTHSKYGVNGNVNNMNEVTINSKNLNNSVYINNAESGTDATKGYVFAVTGYGTGNNANDVNASSTKNITGVFDLNGCVGERVAGYRTGENASTSAWHSLMATSSTNASSEYLTLYPTSYSNCNKYGDAVQETSTSDSDSNSWNSDYSIFVTSVAPVSNRGGTVYCGSSAGIFAFGSTEGNPNFRCGFRAVLVAE